MIYSVPFRFHRVSPASISRGSTLRLDATALSAEGDRTTIFFTSWNTGYAHPHSRPSSRGLYSLGVCSFPEPTVTPWQFFDVYAHHSAVILARLQCVYCDCQIMTDPGYTFIEGPLFTDTCLFSCGHLSRLARYSW